MTNSAIRWLLAGVASAGVVATGVSSSEAMFKICKDNPHIMGDHWTFWDRVKVAAPYYKSTIFVGLAAIGCIIGGNIMADAAQNALCAAIIAAQEARIRSKEKLSEIYVREEEETPVYYRPRLVGDEELYFDMCLGVDDGYFSATPEEMTIALYKLNKEMATEQTVAYERFYHYLNIKPPKGCLNKGWSVGAGIVYGYDWIDADIEEEIFDDGLIVHKFRFVHQPKEDYLDYAFDLEFEKL